MNKKLLLVTIVCCILIAVWFSPFNVGDYRKSPDGKWTAEIQNLKPHLGREDYLRLRIRRNSDERAVMECKMPLLQSDVAPALAHRAQDHIEWSANSTDVTFTLANGRTQKFDLEIPSD